MAVRKGTGAKVPAKNTSNSARKGRGRKPPAGKGKKLFSFAILFWLAFVIVILGLFLFNREAITNGIQIIQNELSAGRSNPVSGTEPPAQPPVQTPPSSPKPSPVQQTPASRPAAQPVPQTPPTVKSPAPAQPAAQTPSGTVPQNVQSEPKAGQDPPAVKSPDTVQRTAEPRDRVLYFSQVDSDGSILRVKVNRKLPVSDSPMTDAIQALISGPNSDEKHRGLISLIPPGTRILSATVKGDTAEISFSEDFQYNTSGVEGYAAQLRQIVYTITEFPNIKNVQILIEGRRVDYLGEGIWIGRPLNRDMF